MAEQVGSDITVSARVSPIGFLFPARQRLAQCDAGWGADDGQQRCSACKFAPDSPLEQAGFELPVPLAPVSL